MEIEKKVTRYNRTPWGMVPDENGQWVDVGDVIVRDALFDGQAALEERDARIAELEGLLSRWVTEAQQEPQPIHIHDLIFQTRQALGLEANSDGE